MISDIGEIGVCRGIEVNWLLLQKSNGRWAMMAEPFGPLSSVINAALKDLGDRDLSFSDQRMEPRFTFPKTPAELARPGATISIMAPEDSTTDVWGIASRDYAGGWSRSSRRFRPMERFGEFGEIARWFRDPHLGGGYASFKPNELPFARGLVVRREWRLRDIAPALFEVAA